MIDLPAIVQEYVTQERESESGKLWPSSVSGCIRREMMRLKKFSQTHPLSAATLWQFKRYGWYEQAFYDALRDGCWGPLETQAEVGNEHWHGYIDLCIYDLDGNGRLRLHEGGYDLVEVKSVSPYAPVSGLPYDHQKKQVWVYWLLCEYRPRRAYLAYIQRWQDGKVPKVLQYDVTPTVAELEETAALMAEFEHWARQPEELPPIPYSHPEDHAWNCTGRSKTGREIRCPYFGHCWPEFMDLLGNYGEPPSNDDYVPF